MNEYKTLKQLLEAGYNPEVIPPSWAEPIQQHLQHVGAALESPSVQNLKLKPSKYNQDTHQALARFRGGHVDVSLNARRRSLEVTLYTTREWLESEEGKAARVAMRELAPGATSHQAGQIDAVGYNRVINYELSLPQLPREERPEPKRDPVSSHPHGLKWDFGDRRSPADARRAALRNHQFSDDIGGHGANYREPKF